MEKVIKFDENIPIVSSGFSMGGQSALVYTVYAKRTPVSCVTNCPVCDMVYHWTERHDLPRTIYSALYNEEGTLTDALKRVSPLRLADKMPDIEYHIIHCDEDKAVNLEAHSEKFIKELEKRNYKVTLDISKGRGHCDWTLDCKRKYMDYIANGICK